MMYRKRFLFNKHGPIVAKWIGTASCMMNFIMRVMTAEKRVARLPSLAGISAQIDFRHYPWSARQ